MTPSGRDAVQFTRESAERIANVVRAAELTPTRGRALSFDAIPPSASRKVIRMATFTGAWSPGTNKTVTLRNSTATLSVLNVLIDLPSNGQRNCVVAKDGADWFLIQWQWDVSNVLSNASLGASSLEFERVKGVSVGEATTAAIDVTECT